MQLCATVTVIKQIHCLNFQDALNKSPNEWLGYNNRSDDIDLNKVEQLISDRNKFRSEKNYQKSDEIRDELKSIGIEIEDTSDGTKWRKI